MMKLSETAFYSSSQILYHILFNLSIAFLIKKVSMDRTANLIMGQKVCIFHVTADILHSGDDNYE